MGGHFCSLPAAVKMPRMPHDQPVVPVAGRDGHRFELIRVDAPDPRAQMLLLPGLGMSARLYINFAKALSRRNIGVHIHEWRGNGSSSLRASRSCSWGYAELLDDLKAARAAVSADSHQKILLGGHSLGGQLTCLSAAADSRNLRGLFVIAGGSPYWRAFPAKHKPLMLVTMLAFPALGTLFGHYPGRKLGFGGNEARGVMQDWGRSARSGQYRPRSVSEDLEVGMRDLELPVLGIRMAQDWLAPPSSLDWLTGKLAGCEVTTQTVQADTNMEKADHYAWMKHPEPTAQIMSSWLGEQPSSEKGSTRQHGGG